MSGFSAFNLASKVFAKELTVTPGAYILPGSMRRPPDKKWSNRKNEKKIMKNANWNSYSVNQPTEYKHKSSEYKMIPKLSDKYLTNITAPKESTPMAANVEVRPGLLPRTWKEEKLCLVKIIRRKDIMFIHLLPTQICNRYVYMCKWQFNIRIIVLFYVWIQKIYLYLSKYIYTSIYKSSLSPFLQHHKYVLQYLNILYVNLNVYQLFP
jgi:hypothetical protein